MRTDPIRRVCEKVRAFARDEQGPTATEYAILLAVIILGSMGIILSIGEKFQVLYTIISDSLPEGFA